MTAADAISLFASDNVATTLRQIEAGERISVSCNGTSRTLVVAERVPLCHKISLASIEKGDAVWKYGQSIGVTTARIAAGVHVHTHNMRSKRAVR